MSPFPSPLRKSPSSFFRRAPPAPATQPPLPQSRTQAPITKQPSAAVHHNANPITILHDPRDAELDIIAVHDLESSYEQNWTHEKTGAFWLRDFLPVDFPKARVMAYNHNAAFRSNVVPRDLPEFGKQFLASLLSYRGTNQARDRPILFIGHGFGGLLIEQALVLAKMSPGQQGVYTHLANSVAGVIFLGTPHKGTGYAAYWKMYCLLHHFEGANSFYLRYLDPSSKETLRLSDDFLRYYPTKSISFYETRRTLAFGLPFRTVVSREDGTRNGEDAYSIDTDHYEMTKYSTREKSYYILVRGKLSTLLATNAPKHAHHGSSSFRR